MYSSFIFIIFAIPILFSGDFAVAGALPELRLTAKLVAPVSSRINKKGDKINVRVDTPGEYFGDSLEGVIEEARSSGDLKKTSSLRFSFQRLSHQGLIFPVTVEIKSVWNSKGQPGVDEEGRVLKKSSSVGKAVAAAAIGAGIGAILGGYKGAAIGGGAGFALGFVLVSVAVKGPDIALDNNATLYLNVKSCERCGEAEHSLNYREFSNGSFLLFHPREWEATGQPGTLNVMVAAPSGIAVQPNGETALGLGVMAGYYGANPAAGGELASSTEGLIRVLQSVRSDLRVISQTPGDDPAQPLYITFLAGASPVETGNSINFLVTWMRPQGLFYFLATAPAARFEESRPVLISILQSLRFRQ